MRFNLNPIRLVVMAIINNMAMLAIVLDRDRVPIR